MPQRKFPGKKLEYPIECYEVVEFTDPTKRNARMTLTYFPIAEKIEEYKRTHKAQTKRKEEAARKKLERMEKKEEERKKRAEERARIAREKPPPKKRGRKRKASTVANKKRKRLLKAGEEDADEEIYGKLEEEEEKDEKEYMEFILKENEEMKRREREARKIFKEKEKVDKLHRRGEDSDYDDVDDGIIIIEDNTFGGVVEIESDDEDIGYQRDNNISNFIDEDEYDDSFYLGQPVLNKLPPNIPRIGPDYQGRVQVSDTIVRPYYISDSLQVDALDLMDDLPLGLPVMYDDAARIQARNDYHKIRREEINRRKTRYSNYFITIVTNAQLQNYSPDEIEELADQLQTRINEQLYKYAPLYIREVGILNPNGVYTDIERIRIITKPELQEGRGEQGQLHAHSIVAITHSSRLQLDYQLINQLVKELSAEFKLEKVGGDGIAKFKVAIQRASDNLEGEYDYLAEDGVTYAPSDVGRYYDEAENAIRNGHMERGDLQKFKKRKREETMSRKNVRELRGQRFNFNANNDTGEQEG